MTKKVLLSESLMKEAHQPHEFGLGRFDLTFVGSEAAAILGVAGINEDQPSFPSCSCIISRGTGILFLVNRLESVLKFISRMQAGYVLEGWFDVIHHEDARLFSLPAAFDP